MARLRLFAGLRELAGTGSAVVPGATVAEVLSNASAYFGPDFADGATRSQVWLNGERAGLATAVMDDDEVSLVPLGTAGGGMVRSPATIEALLLLVVFVILFVTNALGLRWLAVALTLAGALWAYDLVGTAGRRRLAMGAIPVFVAVAAAVMGTYRFGIPGMAAVTAGATLLALAWSIFVPQLRPMESVAGGVLVAAIGALGSGSMILLRLRSESEMTSFLVVATVAVGVSWLVASTDAIPIDALTGGALGALAAGVVAGAIWSDDLWPTVAAGAAAAVAQVAGRNAGSLARSGALYQGGDSPGSLAHLDGVMLAAAGFWVLLHLIG